MVNSITMNIDVREYLRINPISVHELTLSDDDNDCFLFFPNDEDYQTRGYKAFTQRQLFRALQHTIFGNLLTDDNTPRITNDEVELEEGKFDNYVRRNEVEDYMQVFGDKIADRILELDKLILNLNRKGILKYNGAVEL